MIKLLKSIKGDRVIWAIVLLLSVFSVLAVYSSTGTLAFRLRHGNTEYYLLKQIIILIIGLLLVYFTHLIDYNKFYKLSAILYFLTLPALALLFLVGAIINTAARWYEVLGVTFQPSEFAKLALIMFVARLLTKNQDEINDFKKSFLPIFISISVVCVLIFPSNFSTAVLVFADCVFLMYFGGANLKHLGIVFAGCIAMGLIVYLAGDKLSHFGRLGTAHNRMERFVKGDSTDRYQVDQAKIAIATGGFFGKMPGNSTQKNFLPHPYSDFIYAIIIEEFGFAGGIIILLLYLILLYRGIRISTKCPTIFGSLLVMGLTFSLVFQALINMGVAVNILPVTGQTLPMVSMGGTSIWLTCISLGVIISVSKIVDQPIQQPIQTTENNATEKD